MRNAPRFKDIYHKSTSLGRTPLRAVRRSCYARCGLHAFTFLVLRDFVWVGVRCSMALPSPQGEGPGVGSVMSSQWFTGDSFYVLNTDPTPAPFPGYARLPVAFPLQGRGAATLRYAQVDSFQPHRSFFCKSLGVNDVSSGCAVRTHTNSCITHFLQWGHASRLGFSVKLMFPK